ncbi:PREDICTED: canalicular multispecific organic anion transporter 2-like [Amphimedon queenslandica]|uniref:ABC-type glutathione-S-conjugate transporter n=1 Tax=Amphimedon queenslandica TaxID=400682 RepID=A0AAN0JC59_AMPQE|nr:PREDICTED: canalicular multispecific organic anion transporter 2-like [Amphimedon queenslandica]|eukprot:XP_019854605.1 PREDICTED: canalicular multispecific organic anion transporter 2-like [Amphimedon queenslandica]
MPTELMSPVVTLYDISHPPLFDARRSHSGSLKSSDEDEERSFIPSKRGSSRQSSFRSSRSPSMSKGEPNERSKLIGEEKVETGNVKFSVFFDYAKACSLWISFITLFFNMLTDGAAVGQNLWLAHWSNGEEHTNKSNLALNLGVYSALGALQGIMVLFGAFSLYFGALNASMRLHNGMLSNILRSPMSFFDTTPLGRILNRFSKDIYMIDEEIPRSLRSFLITLFTVLSTIVVVSIASPWFMLAVIPLLVVYIVIQRYYVATSRQLRRLESSSRSPIYSHFQETINGSSSIRAYLKVDEFLAQSEAKVDYNQIAYYPSVCADRWLAIRVEFLGNFIILAASLFAVLQRNYDQVFGYISPGIAGLSISYALQVTQELNWMVRMTSELETNIVAVERTKEYSETPTEAPSVIPGRRVPPGWPTEGRVQFDHYSTRYRPGLDLVLKNISCDIPGGQKVGIVGRTGAGKSSLTAALFRIIESAQGRILIDGVDISTYGLNDLRSNLTIIPQDPVLFSGTLRMNLDPFDIHTDDELWRALKTAHLSGFFESLTGGESTITEGGENLSVGQRQLVCLARALLRKTKILVLDEATAAVDVETDELIQKTIRKEFSDCTVLTIAHRLNTIMDYDKIMVLDSGRIREFDTPGNLIEQRGIFYGMVKDAGLVDD